MTPEEIYRFLANFVKGFATLLWNFSEAADLPLGDSAPLFFGLMLDSPGIEVEGVAWKVTQDDCWHCGHEWVSVHQVGTSEQRECPQCGLLMGVERDRPQ